MCRRVEAVQPELECPVGYKKERSLAPSHLLAKFQESPDKGEFNSRVSHRVLAGGTRRRLRCLLETKKQPQQMCPPDYQAVPNPDGSESVVCVAKDRAKPKLECPPGFEDDQVTGGCLKLEAGPVRPVCPATHTMVSGQCVQHLSEAPAIMCPIGYRLFEGVCVTQLRSKPKPVCPPEFQYDELVGACYRMQVDFQFDNVAPPVQEKPKEESILDEILTTTTTPEPRVRPQDILPERQQPTIVQVVQQPVPIPSPVVYLPRQNPPPPPSQSTASASASCRASPSRSEEKSSSPSSRSCHGAKDCFGGGRTRPQEETSQAPQKVVLKLSVP